MPPLTVNYCTDFAEFEAFKRHVSHVSATGILSNVVQPCLQWNSNDRMVVVLEQINHMSERMGSVVKNMGKMERQMKDVTEIEEQVVMKVAKMEDAMWKMNNKI